jgi:alpha-beta hydrolase superfamily lysophospholipase
MAGAGVAVSSFDLVGHGASDGRRAYIERFSDYLDEVEQELSASRREGIPAVLFGHSLGGLIVLDYLSSGRPRPNCAVVSAPALGGGKAWQRALAPVLSRLLPKLAIPTEITGDQLSRDPAVGEQYFADPLVLRKATTRLGAELFAAGDRVRSNLGRLEVPTLVIHGGADTLVPASTSAPLADLPTVERRLYPKLRHETQNEPEGPEVTQEIVEWLRKAVQKQGG